MHVPLSSKIARVSGAEMVPPRWFGNGYAFSERIASLIVVDALVIVFAAWSAALLTPTLGGDAARAGTPWYWYWVLAGGWWLYAALNDLYDTASLRHRTWLVARLAALTTVGLAACLALALLLASPFSLRHLLLFMLIATPLMFLWRWVYLAMLRISALSHRTLIVGQGERARLAAQLVKQESSLNYELVGYVDRAHNGREAARDGLPVWHNLDSLPDLARQLCVHEIVIATEHAPSKALALSLIECQAHGIQVLWLPELYERHRRNVPIDHIDPEWALGAVRAAPTLVQRMAKRALDLVTVLVALPVLLVLAPLIILAIKLDSPGPVLYRQVRLGRAGQPFSILKFRSMYVDAERDGDARWATKGDPRITRVGRVLRKTRLDELPQLINILRGEMSLVGPRPERPEFITQLERDIPYYRTRLLVKPGITGWAQVHYDYTSSIEDTVVKLQYDLFYIHRWSVWLDLYILFRTVAVVLQFKGT